MKIIIAMIILLSLLFGAVHHVMSSAKEEIKTYNKTIQNVCR